MEAPSPELVGRPAAGRVFEARRRVRLADADARGLLRIDAVARFLQDVATDDVEDAGWGSQADVWVVRRTRIDVVEPVRLGETVALATWCSGTGASAAARRTSIEGDGGGRVETETLWIHLDPTGRPARLSERFHEVYGPAGGGRGVTTRLELPDPPPGAVREPWALRPSDVDVMGHVNNAAYWQVLEATGPVSATLEYRRPIDLGDAAAAVRWDGGFALAVGDDVRAVATVARR